MKLYLSSVYEEDIMVPLDRRTTKIEPLGLINKCIKMAAETCCHYASDIRYDIEAIGELVNEEIDKFYLISFYDSGTVLCKNPTAQWLDEACVEISGDEVEIMHAERGEQFLLVHVFSEPCGKWHKKYNVVTWEATWHLCNRMKQFLLEYFVDDTPKWEFVPEEHIAEALMRLKGTSCKVYDASYPGKHRTCDVSYYSNSIAIRCDGKEVEKEV